MPKEITNAFIRFFEGYFNGLIPQNKHIEAFKQRPLSKQLAIPPRRLTDSHAEMLAKWREEGVNGSRSPLPIFLMGLDKSYNSTGLESGRTLSDENYIVRDDQGDYFRLRLSRFDQRLQLVLYCQHTDTAFLFADQFKMYCSQYKNRHIEAIFDYNGRGYGFPLMLEDNHIFATNGQIADQNNLTVYVFDLTFRCYYPYFLGEIETGNPYLSDVLAVNIYNGDQLKQTVLPPKSIEDIFK